MKKLLFPIAIASAMLFAGCDKEEDKTPDNTIGLEKTELEFEWRGDTIVTRTQGSNWHFSAITVGENTENLSAEGQGKDFAKTVDWLALERNGKEITMMIEGESENGIDRTFEIVLTSGDNEERIKGLQRARPIGIWDDVIGLSVKDVSFGQEGGTIEVQTTLGMGWWFCELVLDDERHSVNFDNEINDMPPTVTQDWLTVSRTDTGFTISVDENKTGKERKFTVELQGGDYFDRVHGVQAGK